MATTARRALGRSLSDFWLDGEAGKLFPAEVELLKASASGKACVLTSRLPNAPAANNQVRASFVRFLILGGDADAPVHEGGVNVAGAWIEGTLNLSRANVAYDIALYQCRIEWIEAYYAQLEQSLFLGGSRLELGVSMNGARCKGSIFLGDEFFASKGVNLVGLEADELILSNGRFENSSADALRCDDMRIRKSVYLVRTLCRGAFSLTDAAIGGDLICMGGHFENAGGTAIRCDRVQLGGDAKFSYEFSAVGEVRVSDAIIGGNLDCTEGSFSGEGGNAFNGRGLVVRGGLMFRKVKCKGGVDLGGATLSSLTDDLDSWDGATGAIDLDGLTYGRISEAFMDPNQRIDWLLKQRTDYLHHDFRVQPWDQLMSAFRQMGRASDARSVGIGKERMLTRAGRFLPSERMLRYIQGALTGYGYQPQRFYLLLLALLVFASALFWVAAHPRIRPYEAGEYWIEPAVTRINADCIMITPKTELAKQCPPLPPPMQEFLPPVYAFDTILPVLNLGYKADWRPRRSDALGNPLVGGWIVQITVWILTIFGWIAASLIAVAIGGLVRKE